MARRRWVPIMRSSEVASAPPRRACFTWSTACSAGVHAREAAYSGLKITWDMIMKSQQDMFPKVLDMNARIDVQPVPAPGEYKFV